MSEIKEHIRGYVTVEDIGNAVFLSRDKGILFMRYIRKFLELKKRASNE